MDHALGHRAQQHVADSAHATRAHGNLVDPVFVSHPHDFVGNNPVGSHGFCHLQLQCAGMLAGLGQDGALLPLLIFME